MAAWLGRRRDALIAHATQIDPNSFWFAIPDEVLAEIYPWEDYTLVRSLVPVPEHERPLRGDRRGRRPHPVVDRLRRSRSGRRPKADSKPSSGYASAMEVYDSVLEVVGGTPLVRLSRLGRGWPRPHSARSST